MELGEREIIYLSLHCHHQNDSCIKIGSDESHFNVSVGSVGQSHRTVSTSHNLFEEKGEPKRVSNRGPSAYQPNALPLGQTGSPMLGVCTATYTLLCEKLRKYSTLVFGRTVLAPLLTLPSPQPPLLQPKKNQDLDKKKRGRFEALRTTLCVFVGSLAE